MTRKSNMLLIAHVVLVLINLSSSLGASASVHETFLQCLTNQTKNSSDISNTVYSKSNANYTSVLTAYMRNARFNTSSAPKPVLILTPLQDSHVQAAIICSKKHGLLIKIRSGGHDFEGLSYISRESPFVVLDMFNLKSISVDMVDESAWVEAGATLGELYYSIWEKSKVHGFPAGVCATVGVGGHLTGGGYGTMLRKYGLSVDHIVDAKIVNGNGHVLDRKAMGEDLFWAIRGGGAASFGVILAYKIKLVSVPEIVTVFRIDRTLEQNATDIVFKWQCVVPATDDNLFIRLTLGPSVQNKQMTVKATFSALYLGSADSLVSLQNKEFPELGLKKDDCIEMSWIDSVVYWNHLSDKTQLLDRKLNQAGFLKRKSDYVQKPIPKDALLGLWKLIIAGGKGGLVFNPYGGKMSEVAASETPFPHRAGNLFKIQYSVSWKEGGTQAARNYTGQLKRFHKYMTRYVSSNPRRAFLNYRDIDIGINRNYSYDEGKVFGVKYFDANFDRLVKVKTAVDPHNFFRYEQSIPTLPGKP